LSEVEEEEEEEDEVNEEVKYEKNPLPVELLSLGS
jgi:hypothetical protein